MVAEEVSHSLSLSCGGSQHLLWMKGVLAPTILFSAFEVSAEISQ